MQRTTRGMLAFLYALAGAPAAIAAQDGPPSPAERYDSILAEYQAESGAFRKAATDEERKSAVERLDAFALRFLELLEDHPKDPIALEAALQTIRVVNSVDSLTELTWVMNETAFPEGSRGEPVGRVVAFLRRDHLRSEKIGPICQRMSYGPRREYEAFLRSVLHTNPHPDVRGLACLALAQLLNGRLLKLDLVRDRPELAGRVERLFGLDRDETLRKRDRAEAARDVERFFEKAESEYRDVALPYGGTVGERARSELFELRHLAVGKAAPEIVGVDQEGRRLELGDYRGRVVLLDFWQEL